GARRAPLPNLRTLRRRATPADGARAAVVSGLRPARIEDARLVDARARSAESVLRREHERSVRGAAGAHAQRARIPLSGAARTLAMSVPNGDAKHAFRLECAAATRGAANIDAN